MPTKQNSAPRTTRRARVVTASTSPAPQQRARRSPKTGRARWGQLRQTAAGTWSVRYVGPDGRRVSGGNYPTKAAAERRLRELAYLRDSGSLPVSQRRSPTLQEYYEAEYRRRRTTAASTSELNDNLFRLHLLGDPQSRVRQPSPRLATMPLDKITPATVEAWWVDRAGSPVPRRQAAALLRRVLNVAIVDELLAKNPVRLGSRINPTPSNRPYVNQDLAQRLLAELPTDLRAAFEVLLGAHLRRGELLGLAHGDWDPDTGRLTVARQVRRLKNVPTVTPTKNRTTKVVSLPEPARVALEAYLAEHPPTRKRPRRADEPDPSRWPLVFRAPDGSPLTDRLLQAAWVSARKAVGREDLRIHDLRHAGLTWAAQQGATQRELMARAAHKDHRTAMGYQHADPERDRLIAERIRW